MEEARCKESAAIAHADLTIDPNPLPILHILISAGNFLLAWKEGWGGCMLTSAGLAP